MSERVSLLQAAEDPRLLGAVKLWPVQRELLAAQDDPSKWLFVYRIGRRGGKGRVCALTLAHNVLLSPHLDAMVLPGERRYAVAIARKESQAAILLHTVETIVRASPALKGTIESVTDTEIRFTNNTSVMVVANADSARGIPISALDLSEAAHWAGEADNPEDAGPMSAYAAAAALIPATAQFAPYQTVIVESTPKDRSGYFYDIATQAEAGELPYARAWHYSTQEANPAIDPDFLAGEYARDPQNADVEYGANWSDGGAAKFIDFARFQPPAREGDIAPDLLASPVVVGLDCAFSGYDLMGVCVVGRDPANLDRLLVAHVAGLRPGRASTFARRAAVQKKLLDRIVALAKKYDAMVAIDQYSSVQVRAHLTAEGVRCKVLTMGAVSKTAAYVELRDRLYGGLLDLPADGELLADLRRVRTRVTDGSSRVIVPRVGGSRRHHGDRGDATALAVARQAELAATGPSSPPSGGPPLAGVATGDAVLRQRTPSDIREARASNKFGRAGKKDPDREGVRFPGGPGVKQF